LDLKDPWVASALAVAAKAHSEAAPTEAATIKARVFGAKTVGDLDAYVKDMTPVVNNARAVARTRKVAARKQPVAGPVLAGPVLTGPVLTGPVLTGQVGATTVGTIVRDHEPMPQKPESTVRDHRPPLRTP
jgi:hypothetical protein